MDNLRDRRQSFTMEIRKRQLDQKINYKRKIEQKTSELESKILDLNIAEIIEEAMDLSLPAKELTDRMRRLRQLTSCDNFSVPRESATPRLMAFFAELLKYEEIELLEEVTWCLINLFADRHFSEIDSTPVIFELNRLIDPSQKISLLELIFHLIGNIGTNKIGAILLLQELNFERIEKVVEMHMTLISKFFAFSAEILSHHPKPQMEYVRLSDHSTRLHRSSIPRDRLGKTILDSGS